MSTTRLCRFFSRNRAAVFIPKLTGYYSLKLAGVLHCLRMLIKTDGEIHRLIDEETVQGAINLTKFYAGQAIKALRLYQPQDTRLTEFQKRAIQTLYKLRDEVRQGKLSIATITDTFNQGLLKQVRHDRRQIGGILRGLTLTVAKGTPTTFPS